MKKIQLLSATINAFLHQKLTKLDKIKKKRLKLWITNLILGSTECRNVTGDDMNCPIGLPVALEINLNTFSAPSPGIGNRFTQFPVFPPSPSTVALTQKTLFAAGVPWSRSLGIAKLRPMIGGVRWRIGSLGIRLTGREGCGVGRFERFMSGSMSDWTRHALEIRSWREVMYLVGGGGDCTVSVGSMKRFTSVCFCYTKFWFRFFFECEVKILFWIFLHTFIKSQLKRFCKKTRRVAYLYQSRFGSLLGFFFLVWFLVIQIVWKKLSTEFAYTLCIKYMFKDKPNPKSIQT